MQKQQRHLDPDIIANLTPRGGLQAAEFEDQKLGHLSVDRRDVVYTDARSSVRLLRMTFASSKEAKMQVAFYRSTYEEVKARRSSLHIVQS